MIEKFLVKMDDKLSKMNYEILDQDTDEALYNFISSRLPGKKITLKHEGRIFSYRIGKKEEAGYLSTIYEDNGKYYTKSGDKYYLFPL